MKWVHDPSACKAIDVNQGLRQAFRVASPVFLFTNFVRACFSNRAVISRSKLHWTEVVDCMFLVAQLTDEGYFGFYLHVATVVRAGKVCRRNRIGAQKRRGISRDIKGKQPFWLMVVNDLDMDKLLSFSCLF